MANGFLFSDLCFYFEKIKQFAVKLKECKEASDKVNEFTEELVTFQ